MHFILAILFSFQINSSYLQWKEIKVDEILTMKIPDNFEKSDTLEQTLYFADGEYSVITLSKLPISKIPEIEELGINTSSKLKEFYDGFQNGAINNQQARITHSSDILVDSLEARFFRIDYENGEVKINHLILAKDQIYLGSVWFNSEDSKLVENEKNTFFDSFNFNIEKKNQLPVSKNPDSLAYELGQTIGYISLMGIIAVIIILIIRKRK